MDIPKTGLLLRYIAAQGPLRHTCSDFWQMVWEQESTLIIMLTTTTEGGKVGLSDVDSNLRSCLTSTHWSTVHVAQENLSVAPFSIACFLAPWLPTACLYSSLLPCPSCLLHLLFCTISYFYWLWLGAYTHNKCFSLLSVKSNRNILW